MRGKTTQKTAGWLVGLALTRSYKVGCAGLGKMETVLWRGKTEKLWDVFWLGKESAGKGSSGSYKERSVWWNCFIFFFDYRAAVKRISNLRGYLSCSDHFACIWGMQAPGLHLLWTANLEDSDIEKGLCIVSLSFNKYTQNGFYLEMLKDLVLLFFFSWSIYFLCIFFYAFAHTPCNCNCSLCMISQSWRAKFCYFSYVLSYWSYWIKVKRQKCLKINIAP